jgi:hypothetical protein
MKGTIFIVGPLHEARPFLISSLDRQAHVCVFSTAAEMEKQLRERLLPDVVILSVTGVPADDLLLFTLLEQYWEGGPSNLVLITPFPWEQSTEPLFYAPYAGVCFVQPVDVAAVVKAAEQMMQRTAPR